MVQSDLTPLAEVLQGLGVPYAGSIGAALTFLLTFVLIFLVGRIVIVPLVNRTLRSRDLDEHARKPLKKLVSIVIIFAGIAVAFGVAQYGSFLQSLATIAAAPTLAIGLAMQDVLKNFVAGI